MKTRSRILLLLLILAGLAPVAGAKNGFNLSNLTVPISEVFSGGPPRDGIPSIDDPKFESVAAASWLRDDDLVVGVSVGDEDRAYPIRILVWHEIVNDTVGGEAVAVTYCPLCGTAMTFDRRINGKTLSFGVSGLLYQSDVLMYDRETESLWSQLAMKSLSGPSVGLTLTWLPSDLVTWKVWRETHPDTLVLSRDTGERRDYDHLPYEGYEDHEETIFPVPAHRTELPNKEWVVGLLVDGAALALPVTALAEQKGADIPVTMGGSTITVRHDPGTRRVTAHRADGELIPLVHVYWFAWQAFYPDTVLWEN